MPEIVAPSTIATFPKANPSPLGLSGFGLTTFVLSAINAGLLPSASVAAVVPLAFAYGGGAQILAGIFEYRNGNTFGMVAFSSYGLFWWWFAFLQWSIGAGWLKTPPAEVLGIIFFFWSLLTFFLWIASFRLSKGVWSVFLLLTLTFLFLAGGDCGFGTAKLGGYIGMATGLDAMVVAFFEVVNATAGRTVLPLGEPFISS